MSSPKAARVGLALATLIGLAGCSSLSQGTLDTFRAAFSGAGRVVDESRLSPKSAYLLLSASDGELVMGRGFSDEGLETWYGAGEELLSLRNGIIVNSQGMLHDIADLRWEGPHPWLHGLDVAQLPVTYKRQADRLPGHFNEVTEYRLEDQGERTIKLWGREVTARRLQERVLASNASRPLPGNTYWLVERRVAQSRQWLAPDHDVLLTVRPESPLATPAVVQAPAPVDPAARQHTLVAVAPTRLNELLRRYPLPQAWLPGSAWLVRGEEQAQRLLKRGVLFDVESALAGNELPAATRVRLQAFRARLTDMPVTGRKPLPPLNARWLQGNPKRDPVLDGGDRLVRPLHAPLSARVMGDVAVDCELPVGPELTVRAAVAACLDRRFLPDHAYLITPEGRVLRTELALWNRGSEVGVMPGARILVPFHGLAAASGNAAADADLAAWLATQLPSAPLASDPGASLEIRP